MLQGKLGKDLGNEGQLRHRMKSGAEGISKNLLSVLSIRDCNGGRGPGRDTNMKQHLAVEL
jgi:hypothetical protein